MLRAKIKLDSKTNVSILMAHRDYICDLLPENISEITIHDAEYHGSVSTAWAELTRQESLHVKEYHVRDLSVLEKLQTNDSTILELGGGVGLDAKIFIDICSKKVNYIFSDVSDHMVYEAEKNIGDTGNIVFCLIDGSNILISNNEVESILMVGAFHHLQDIDNVCQEFTRILKPNSYFMLSMEPNITWYKVISILAPFYRLFFKNKDHSEADEHMDGFSYSDFKKIGAKNNWEIHEIIPSWFLVGIYHYFTELIFRVFRLNKKPKISDLFIRALIDLDELIEI